MNAQSIKKALLKQFFNPRYFLNSRSIKMLVFQNNPGEYLH